MQIKRCEPALIVAGVISALAQISAAQEDSEISSFFDRFTANRSEIAQLAARFVQTTETPDETVESTGTILYTRVGGDEAGIHGKRLVFRYDDPPLQYMIDGLTAYEYDPELQQIQIFSLQDRPEAEAFYLGFDSNTERLMDAYAVRLQPPDASNPGGMAVALVPKDPESEDAFFEMVILQLRPGDLLPVHIRIVNDAESETAYQVSDFSVSGVVDLEAAMIHVPAGTAIIEEDVYFGTAPEGGLDLPVPETNEPAIVDSEDLDENSQR